MKLYSNGVKEMTDSSTKGIIANGSMDRMKKLLSPGTRKKVLSNVNRTFGVHLDDLLGREGHKYKVPFAVMKICETIAEKGLEQEGIFRVNGSSRIIDKLKVEFDLHGDANLEEDGDICAVAGLLKLFLRELPTSLIPENRTKQFVCIQDAYQNDENACLNQVKQCLQDLPKEHYNLLKYLSGFLVAVAKNENRNKMSARSLAIVFGPNIFRCGHDQGGFRDQGVINKVVEKFIFNYNSLFRKEKEDPPEIQWHRKNQKTPPPPRPPPPKVYIEDKPVPSPRKIRHENYDNGHYQDGEEFDHYDHSETSSSLTVGKGNIHSPMFSDDELTGRAASPFILDSDGGYSIIESPVPSARASKVIEHAITKAVTNIFGDDNDTDVEDDHHHDHQHDVLVRNGNSEHSFQNNEEAVPIFNRIKAFEEKESDQMEVDMIKPGKMRPTSKAFDMFEREGIIIGQAPRSTHANDGHSKVSGGKDHYENGLEDYIEDDGQDVFEVVRRNSNETLSSFKRTAGPANRRSPSRKSRGSFGDDGTNHDEIPEIPPKHNKTSESNEPVPIIDGLTNNNQENEDSNMNLNNPKPRVAFLELTNNREEIERRGSPDMSPSRSPSNSRKPFIPPLDLSTLHEHVDSADPILATKGHSVSYLRAKNQVNHDDVLVSPRTNKLKKTKTSWIEFDYDEEGPLSPSAFLPNSGVHNNTDFPPSPPVDQEQYRKHSAGSVEDDFTLKQKQILKKIQTIKKKIRLFEEEFEREQGFKPSHADKISKTEVKKWLGDLTRAKKDLRKLKEEEEMGSRSRHGSGASSSGERMDPPDLPPTMEQTLILILKKLKDKRREHQRPEDIELMNRDQVQEEKLAVQKALLHFENVHGRPKVKEDKDLMRPLYDRYRQIKRLITKPSSPREKKELQTVPEDRPIDLLDPSGSKVGSRNPIILPQVEMEEEDHNDEMGTMDFAVTRDFSIIRNSGRNVLDHKTGHSPKVKLTPNLGGNSIEMNEANLHEMDLPQLQDELMHSRSEKKRLRRLLRNFEEDFLLRTGRKVQRDDREPLNSEYQEYKQIKAKLKLLDALISKYQQTSDA